MTVVLSGIGADSTNLGRVAPLYDDGGFEYIPIPEKTRVTDELHTYDTWPLRAGGVAADLVDEVTPNPAVGVTYRRESAIRNWPLHHDPNFEALTYGEHQRGNYLGALAELEAGDVVGFYAGLQREDGPRTHRYLVGSMTVERVTRVDPSLSRDEKADLFAAHPKNAHAKRAVAGQPFYADEPILLVDGREPGGLLQRDPIRLSEYYVKPGNQREQYYLSREFADRFRVRTDADHVRLQFKPALVCDLTAAEFESRLEERPLARE